jgi:FdhD protein
MSVMTTRRRIVRVSEPANASGTDAGSATAAERGDELTVEAPLNLVIDHAVMATLMRTPGHDLELAAGWLVVESGVRSPADLRGLRQCRTEDDLELRAADVLHEQAALGAGLGAGLSGGLGGGLGAGLGGGLGAGRRGRGVDQVHLSLADGVEPPRPRSWVTGTSCGVCSADVLDLAPLKWAAPSTADWTVPAAVLQQLPESMRSEQRTFARTGSLHAAGLATALGELLVVREDIGRHNAVDKVTGWSLMAGRLPATDLLLVVSGRVSFEIVQKAIAAAVAGIVAVSAPSDLAVDLARDYGLLLAGMVRPGRMNLYAGDDRVKY